MKQKSTILINNLKTNLLKTIILFFLLVNSIFSQAQFTDSIYSAECSIYLEVAQNEDTMRIETKTEKNQEVRRKKWVAALLCLSLGPFGMHRLYLGTTPQVAAAYSATLGGIGVLPLVDLFVITFSKDISSFRNNSKVIMWKK